MKKLNRKQPDRKLHVKETGAGAIVLIERTRVNNYVGAREFKWVEERVELMADEVEKLQAYLFALGGAHTQ